LQEVLDQALHDLPEHHRAVLLLCCLEGRTQEEAARQLRCPLGTVRSRLARGRKALQDALARRGLALSAAALATALAASGGRAEVTARLLPATLEAALRFAAGDAAAGLVSARAADLAEAALPTMAAGKAKAVVALVLAVGLTAGAAGALARQGAGAGPAEEPAQAREAQRPAERPGPRTDRFGDPLPEGAVARLGTLRLYHGRDLCRVVLSPDGKLVSGTDNSSHNRLWDAVSGRELELPDALKNAFLFAAKGKLLAAEPVAGGNRLIDLATLKEVAADGIDVEREIQRTRYIGKPETLSPDGSVIVARQSKGLKLLDGASRRELPSLEGVPAKEAFSVTFSPDGKLLAAPFTHPVPAVWLWDLSTRKLLRKLTGKDYQIFHAAFSADGRLLAAADGGGITLWETKTGRWLHDFGQTYCVDAIAFAPDGKRVVTGAGYTDTVARLWDPLTGRETGQLRGHTAGIEDAAYAPDGRLVATASQDHTVRLWDVATGREVRRLDANDGMVYAMAFAHDGRTVAAGGWHKAVHLWDVATGRQLRALDNPGSLVLQLAFSPDGKVIATWGFQEKCIRLWDVGGGKEIRQLAAPAAGCPSLAFTPDGRTLAAGGDDAVVYLWDVETGKEQEGFGEPVPAGKRVLSVALSPDGRALAAGYDDMTVRLWEMASGRERASYRGHRAAIKTLAFSADGRLLASGSTDRTVVIWDVTGHLTGRRPRPADLTPDKLNALWASLADADAARAYRAAQVLFGAGDQAVALLKDHLRPAAAGDARRIDRLLAELDSDAFAVREKAARQLAALGEAAEAALRKVLAGKPSSEVRRRAEELLAALDLARSQEWLRSVRALEVLEHVGTGAAKELLEALAKGAPGARLTREARASLQHLDKRADRR
jgi:WD40 repeat protein